MLIQPSNPFQVFHEDNFREAFEEQLSISRVRGIIQSPWWTLHGVERFHPAMKAYTRRGLPLCVWLGAPDNWQRRREEAVNPIERAHFKEADLIVELLRSTGAHVSVSNDVHDKVFVFDLDTLWDGSLNIFSYTGRRSERMTRIINPVEVECAMRKYQFRNCAECLATPPLTPVKAMLPVDACVGELIAEQRRRMKLTQQQLANIVGTTRLTINRIERGHRQPPLDLFLRISHALDRAALWTPGKSVQALEGLLSEQFRGDL